MLLDAAVLAAVLLVQQLAVQESQRFQQLAPLVRAQQRQQLDQAFLLQQALVLPSWRLLSLQGLSWRLLSWRAFLCHRRPNHQ
jgi:hypothetical protein